MAPKDAKVWNEDLVLACRSRQQIARQNGKRTEVMWGEAATVLESVRKDIYQFKTGRLVNYPSQKLSKTVDAIIRKIIDGQANLLPDGYIPSNVEEQNRSVNTNPFENSHYLRNIKIRGGAFSILMAFYVCRLSRQTMTKDQIIKAAQPFCDDALEGNFHAGRPIGAWKGHETLIKHNLLHRERAGVAYSERAGGLRSLGKNSYTLSREGELFIQALFDRNPDIRRQMDDHVSNQGQSSMPFQTSQSQSQSQRVFSSPQRSGSSISTSESLSANKTSDKKRLVLWAETAGEGDFIEFNVGKDRRKHLHDLCDKLTRTKFHARGMLLDHRSNGEQRGRALKVTLVRSGPSSPSMRKASPFATMTPVSEDTESGDEFMFHAVTESPSVSPFSGVGRALTDKPPAAKRALSSGEAAANAAMKRQSLFTSQQSSRSNKAKATKSGTEKARHDQKSKSKSKGAARGKEAVLVDLTLDDDEDVPDDTMETKPVARSNTASKRKLNFDNKSVASVLNMLDSDSDDDDELFKPIFKKRNTKQQSTSLPSLGEGVNFSVLIDSRERNRNCTPRYLRTELTRLVSGGPIAGAWPSTVPVPDIEESTLSHGDFNFVTKKEGLTSSTLPVMIERKRIGDLVQRSASKDHWGQLQRMQNRSRVSFLLLEGDFRSAAAYVSYGAKDDEWNKTDHVIDDENSLLRFIGRSILSSSSVRFMQTKDEQETLRWVSAAGLVTALSNWGDQTKPSNPYKKREQLLVDRLREGGIPWQIAKPLCEEIGSASRLRDLYDTIKDEECCSQLLTPLIDDAAERFSESSSSALSWSQAIHKVFMAKLCSEEAARIRQQYDEFKTLTSDDAALLKYLHAGLTPENAINATFDTTAQHLSPRRVTITLPSQLNDVFPCEDGAFYLTKRSWKVGFVQMQTSDQAFESDTIDIVIMSGEQFVEKLKSCTNRHKSSCYEASIAMASELAQRYTGRKAHGRSILIIKGLRPAMDKFAKTDGYPLTTRFAADLVLSHLTVSHNIIVLQAIRKENDLEKILRALALACFQFQLLTRKIV